MLNLNERTNGTNVIKMKSVSEKNLLYKDCRAALAQQSADYTLANKAAELIELLVKKAPLQQLFLSFWILLHNSTTYSTTLTTY